MKKVILLALFVPFTAFGQISDNFESATLENWTQSINGHWKSDAVSSLSGHYSLHHVFDNPDAGTDQVGIPLRNLHPNQDTTRWSFLLKYGYDPSSLNNWSVFLMSDNGPADMSADGKTRGYALGVNLTGSDDILRLWKINGSQLTEVVNSGINWPTDIGLVNISSIIVERCPEGKWLITVRSGSYIRSSTGYDNELFSQAWFGIYYKYSSTRDRLLWLDDILIEGCFYEDLLPPVISNSKVTGNNSIEISLNEEPAEGIITGENIFLNSGEISLKSVIRLSKLTYQIEFEGEFINKSVNTLKFNKLCDLSGNCSLNPIVQFTPVWAEPGDIVITEIMADPFPEVSLPGNEYIEIANRIPFPVNLKKWELTCGSQTMIFPEVTIQPSGIIILCAPADTALFRKFGNVEGINQFPSLTDDGRMLFISDSLGNLIHGIEYSKSLYGDELKSHGGWSLEMIDTDYPFFSEGNWKVSESRKGGTPGAPNSVKNSNTDFSFYGLLTVFPEDSLTILVKFSEPVFSLTGNNVKVGEEIIDDVFPADPLLTEYRIKLKNPLRKGGLYHLEINENVCDFAGNRIQKSDLGFGLPSIAEKRDILFNELLFNPVPGEPDYLELYNNSEKVLDALRLQIVSVNDLSGEKFEPVQLSQEHKCILPGEYYAITSEPEKILQRYFSASPEHLFRTSSLPSMPDSKGHLIIYNMEMDLIDEVSYNEDLHYSLLAGTEGVSLEKINPANTSEESSSWHSATESCGWGTPGAPNSVFKEMPENGIKVVFSSTKITPDNNGYEDFLTIGVQLQGNGNVISVTVFDEAGNYVKKLASNLFAGQEASIIWDGTADDGSEVNTGIYIILITLYDDTGKTEKWKKVCSVIR